MTELTARELLVMLYQVALDAVDGRYLVNRWLRENQPAFNRQAPATHCVAIGKAAAAMLQGALDNTPSIKHSLLICPASKITRQLKKNKDVICHPSSHPLPDETSLAAGQALVSFVERIEAKDKILFLISGGTSSLVEVPVENVSLSMLQQINNYLLSCGKDIHQVNCWRQQFSKIKGGGLLRWLKTSQVTQLLLSDVKGDKAEFIGSGLLVNTSQQPETDAFLSELIGCNASDKAACTSPVTVDTHVIGNIKTAMLAVHEAAQAEGLNSTVYDEFLEGDACEVAGMLYQKLKQAKPGVHIWGGETTVRLPENPGVGGRNQTLALAFAEHLGEHPDLHLLAAGTDGIDGNTNCAGAAVSMYTSKKARAMGFDLKKEIEKANAGMVLMATDDLVQGAHSNTNVMDIVIAYKIA